MFGSIALNFFTDSSESDSEDVTQSLYCGKLSRSRYGTKERVRRLQQQRHLYKTDDPRLQRRILRDATNVLELPEEEFFRIYRVNKLVFSKVLEEITPYLQTKYRITHVPEPIQLSQFLAFIATGVATAEKEYASVMCKSQVSKTICEILDIFEQNLYTKWLTLEQNEESENLTKQYFHKISGIDGIAGCVDNMHVRIKTPDKEIRRRYKNNLGFPSLNVIMICDHNMVIKYVDASQPGSYSDSSVWDQSSADNFFRTKYINGKINTWLIGDSAYKLLPYMMTPYRNPREEHHKLFNEKILKANDTIKQCLSVLRKRFNCLATPKGLYYSPEKATKAVISCCILHNICIAYKNKWLPAGNTLEEICNDDDRTTDHITNKFTEGCPEAISIREELALQTFLMTKNVPDTNRLRSFGMRLTANVLDFPDDKFMKSFGVSKDVFCALLEEIRPKLKVTYRITHTPAVIKLATFLEFITTGSQLAGLEHEYTETISKSQLSKIICEMLDIFHEHMSAKWIKLDQTPADEKTVREQFYNGTGLPGVVGCVDNMHIQIKTPGKEVKKLYMNRKGFYSLNVLIICDYNMVIKYVDPYQPGSYHDAYVWDQSSADSYFAQKAKTWLIGDAAYKLQPYLMIPYKYPSQPHEYKFNEKHLRARDVIVKCCDILKKRFKCLTTSTGLQYTPEKASKIVISCCILHNICMTYKSYWTPDDVTEDAADNDDEENIIEAPNIEYSKSLRNNIAINLY